MNSRVVYSLAILGIVLLGAPSWGQEKGKVSEPTAPAAKIEAPQAEPAKVPENEPKQVLRRMCDYLKSLEEFSFKGEVTDDHTYSAGNKLQFAFGLEGYVKRPDKIRFTATGDLQNKEVFYDGQTFTIYDTAKKVYATAAMPPTIDEALAKLNSDYDISLIPAQLAKTTLFEEITEGVKDQVYVGKGTVFGVKCQHVALDKGKAVVQLWVEDSDKPVLRKVVVTYKDVDFSPQWTMYLTEWNVSPQLADNRFTFSPPEGAEKIDFMAIKKVEAPQRGKGQSNKKGGRS
ncbi:MAG: DUF2092 domain-containing protein [Deltaproteobacteria bacterium]|nr:DUF2092 domain-containing protein [Deltaproteobacteria bacterium]